MKQEKTERKSSMVLGILSICLFFLTWPGIVMSIIGLSIKKSEKNRSRDIALNVIGLILSSLWTWFVLRTMFAVGKALSGY